MQLNELYEQLNQILLEARYEDMFSDELIDAAEEHIRGFRESDIRDDIRWAKKTLKKNDRIVWFLRWSKLDLVRNLVARVDTDNREDLQKIVNAEIKRYNKKTKGTRIRDLNDLRGKTVGIDHLQGLLEHYLSLDINKIQEYTFDWQTPEELIHDFEDYEKEWKETRKRFIPDDEDLKVFLDVGGGFQWVDLERASCPKEGDAMGHCGNEPASRDPNQTILSLREKHTINGETWWKPVATFIYHKKEKALGEMKGYANDKPKSKYHKYITPLLMDKRIQKMRGGGYMPESNFSIEDLPEQEQKKIFDKKPQLMTLKQYMVRNGVDKHVIDELKEEIDFDSKGHIIFNENMDINEMTNFYGTRTANLLSSALKGGSVDADWSYGLFENDEAEDNLDDKTKQALWSHLKENFESKEYEEYDNVIDAIEVLDDDLYSDIKNAWVIGYEIGTNDEMMDDLTDAIDKNMNENDIVYFEADEKVWHMDSKFNLKINLEEFVNYESKYNNAVWEGWDSENESFLEYIDNYMDNNSDIDTLIDIKEPHYGWSDFDQDAYNENIRISLK